MTKQRLGRFGVFLVAVAMVMAFVADAALGQQQPVAFGTLRGRVVDAVSGDPVPRARLRLTAYGMTAVADDLGVYVFTGVPLGATTLIASAPGYRDYVQNIEIFGGPQTLDVLLTPVGAPPAAPPAAPPPLRPPQPPPARAPESAAGLYVLGGMARFENREFNQRVIGDYNAETYDEAAEHGMGSRMSPIDNGFFGELGLRLGASPLQLMLGAQYLKPSDSAGRFQGAEESVFLGCDYSVGECYWLVERSASRQTQVAPTVLGAVARIALVAGGEGLRLILAGGVGYYQATVRVQDRASFDALVEVHDLFTGSIDYEDVSGGFSASEEYAGSGLGYEGSLTLGLALGRNAELRAGASYVQLEIPELRSPRQRLPAGLNLTGLRFFLGLGFGF